MPAAAGWRLRRHSELAYRYWLLALNAHDRELLIPEAARHRWHGACSKCADTSFLTIRQQIYQHNIMWSQTLRKFCRAGIFKIPSHDMRQIQLSSKVYMTPRYDKQTRSLSLAFPTIKTGRLHAKKCLKLLLFQIFYFLKAQQEWLASMKLFRSSAVVSHSSYPVEHFVDSCLGTPYPMSNRFKKTAHSSRE